MTINIGYCAATADEYLTGLTFDPAFHPTREIVPTMGRLRKCPASIEYSQSAFNFKSPFDLVCTVQEANNGNRFVEPDLKRTSLNPSLASRSLNLESDFEGSTAQLLVYPRWMFISDTPNVTMTVTSAYAQVNPSPVRGQFDIYSWFRPILYAFEYEVGKEITIVRNQPIFQVKFYHPSETRFNLRQCVMTREIELLHQGHRLSNINRLTNWDSVFKFAKKRRPKSVLRFRPEEGVV